MDIYEYIMTAPERSLLELDESQVEELRDFITSIMKWNQAEDEVNKNTRDDLFKLIADHNEALQALNNLHSEMLRYRWDTEGEPTHSYKRTMKNAESVLEKAGLLELS